MLRKSDYNSPIGKYARKDCFSNMKVVHYVKPLKHGKSAKTSCYYYIYLAKQ